MSAVGVWPFVFLALAICCVWVPALPVGRYSIAASALPFLASLATGIAVGVLTGVALLSIALLTSAALASKVAKDRAVRVTFTIATVLIALEMALHWAPGFVNPKLLDGVKLSAGSATFTQYLNYDKGAAGLVVLAAYGPRVRTAREFMRVMKVSVPLSVMTAALVVGAAIVMGYVRPDFKLPSFTLEFLATNLFFTCVAEEAFFRGFLQERLTALLGSSHFAAWGPVLLTGLLFGAAHAAGGSAFLALASIAGVGYSIIYGLTRRIEASVYAHFFVNTIQFIGFSYPYLLG